MPAFNSEDTIESSIESVVCQEFENWELIIVNDKSRDKTVSIIKRYVSQDERIRLINLDSNLGVSNARNKGIEDAKGNYIAFS